MKNNCGMKNKILVLVACVWMVSIAKGQNSVTVNTDTTDNLYNDTIKHEVLGDKPDVKKDGDTTRIRLGNKGIIIVEKNGKTTVKIDKPDSSKNEENADNFDSFEQDKPDYNDNSSKDEKPKKHFEPHYGGVELFLNNYVTSNNSLTLQDKNKYMDLNTSRSMGVNVNFEYGIPITNRMGFVTGLGICFNSYYFNNSNNIQKNDTSGIIEIKPLPTGASYDKTKFRDTYINIPLLYEFQFPSGHKKPLYFSFGIIGGIKISSSTKEIYQMNGKEVTTINHSDLNLAPFRYGLQARAGFSFVNLFATYYPTGLFEKDKGPELYPIEVGLTLVSF